MSEDAIGEFPKSYGSQCSVCKNGLSRYGLNRLQQIELAIKQNWKCSICEVGFLMHQGKGRKSGQIDHTAGTKGTNAEVRGILCADCNRVLSNSTYEWISKVKEYLRPYNES